MQNIMHYKIARILSRAGSEIIWQNTRTCSCGKLQKVSFQFTVVEIVDNFR